jgi:hypothetical protein
MKVLLRSVARYSLSRLNHYVSTRLPACLLACLPVCLPAYWPICLPTYLRSPLVPVLINESTYLLVATAADRALPPIY